MQVSVAQAYALARAAGASAQEATILAAIAGPESGYNSDAHNGNAGTGDNSYGLWQINMLGSMGTSRASQWGLSSYDQLFDPLVNASAAVSILRSQGLKAWSTYTSGAYQGYMQAANSAAYTVGENWQPLVAQATNGQTAGYNSTGGGGGSMGGGTAGVQGGSPGPTGTTAPAQTYKLPAGGIITTLQGAYRMVLYQVGQGTAGQMVTLAFALPTDGNFDTSGLPTQDVSFGTWQAWQNNIVMGGNAQDLDSVAKNYGDFQSFFKWILDTHLGPNEDAKNDPGVLKVMAQLAARPDMSDAEVQNLMKTTDYWKNRTEGLNQWNDLSPAEQEKRVDDVTQQLSDQFFQLAGVQYDPTNTQMASAMKFWATLVASGQRGLNTAIQSWVKVEALKNPESPWSRTIRTEQENQRQEGINVSNQVQTVKEAANKWGVQLSDPTMQQWGSNIVDKKQSDADLTNYLKQQAQILYPWMKQLDPSGTLDTQTLATPWLQTYARVMEKPADILNPQVQQALQGGQPAWQFEQELKQRPEWLQTKNAQDALTTAAGDIGQRMGFG